MQASRRDLFKGLFGLGLSSLMPTWMLPSITLPSLTMVTSDFAFIDAEVVAVWQQTLDREMRMKDPLFDPMYGLVGKGSDSLLVEY